LTNEVNSFNINLLHQLLTILVNHNRNPSPSTAMRNQRMTPKTQFRGVFNGLARILDDGSYFCGVLRTRMQPIKFAKKTQGFGVPVETQPALVVHRCALAVLPIF
jgi:hypothetical protein